MNLRRKKDIIKSSILPVGLEYSLSIHRQNSLIKIGVFKRCVFSAVKRNLCISKGEKLGILAFFLTQR
jgi:hypothetical protein